MKEKPEIGKSVLFCIAGLIAYWLLLLVVGFILSLLFWLLLKIPVIKHLIALLFHLRGDTPDALVRLIAVIVAYSVVVWMLSRFCDLKSTEVLSLKLCGIVLFFFSFLFLIINIVVDNEIIVNVYSAIAACIMFLRGHKLKKEINTNEKGTDK